MHLPGNWEVTMKSRHQLLFGLSSYAASGYLNHHLVEIAENNFETKTKSGK
jgi:hypothetical protein